MSLKKETKKVRDRKEKEKKIAMRFDRYERP